MEENGKRSDLDRLALMLQKAHFRYVKGLYSAVLETSFANINEIFDNPEIDDETYELVGATMTDIRQKIAEYEDARNDPELE